MKSLIIGGSGQDGPFLADLLIKQGLEVLNVSRSSHPACLDISNAVELEAILLNYRPDYIFHLAAISTVSHEALIDNHKAISTGTVQLLDFVERHCPNCRVLIAGSALQFSVKDGIYTEEDGLDYSNAYAISRNHSLHVSRYYRARGLQVYFAFLFHHDSPLRGKRHLTYKIASAAVSASKGIKERVVLGDPGAVKEFTFAGDVMNALWIIVNQTRWYEFVVGSGVGHSMGEWADACFGRFDLNWRDYVDPNPEFASTRSSLVSNPSRLFCLGWRPVVSFCELANMMLTSLKH